MKIAIFFNQINRGAWRSLSASLAKGLAGIGCSVDVVSLTPRDDAAMLELSHKVSSTLVRGRRFRYCAPFLAHYMRTRRPDVLISMSFPANVAAILARMISGWRGLLVITEHSTMSYYAAFGGYKPDFIYSRAPLFARHLYPKADGIVTVSDSILKDLTEIIGDNHDRLHITSISNPIDENIINAMSEEDVEHPWLKTKTEPVIINVGRLVHGKNHGLLLEAFALLLNNLRARLIILGEGPKRNRIERKIEELGLEERVDLPGYDHNPYRYLARADLFVLSSEEEGFGLILLEAMSCGCPIVATRCQGGAQDVLDSGRCGVLVPPGQPGPLAAAMLRLLDDPEHRGRLTELGHARKKDYDPLSVANLWKDFILGLSAQRGRV